MTTSDIRLDELKAKLRQVNPKDYFSGTLISEIFKTSTDFEIKLLNTVNSIDSFETEGDRIIKLTFIWNGHPFERRSDGSQLWYMDVEEYLRMDTRFVLVEKTQKI